MNRQSEFYKGIYFYDSYKNVQCIMESKDPERVEWVTELVNNIQRDFSNKDITHLKILIINREDINMLLLFPVMDECLDYAKDIDESLSTMSQCTRTGLTFYVPIFKMKEAQKRYGKGNVTFTGFTIQLSTIQTKVPEMTAAKALLGGS